MGYKSKVLCAGPPYPALEHPGQKYKNKYDKTKRTHLIIRHLQFVRKGLTMGFLNIREVYIFVLLHVRNINHTSVNNTCSGLLFYVGF